MQIMDSEDLSHIHLIYCLKNIYNYWLSEGSLIAEGKEEF